MHGAIKAKMELEKEYNIHIRVIDIHTIKPIDRDIIIKAARETKTAEARVFETKTRKRKGGAADGRHWRNH